MMERKSQWWYRDPDRIDARLAVASLSPEILMQLLLAPTDMTLVSLAMDERTIKLVVTHPELPTEHEGFPLPTIEPFYSIDYGTDPDTLHAHWRCNDVSLFVDRPPPEEA